MDLVIFKNKLYYAINASRNICPTGWYVPTGEDWATLIEYAGGESVAGGNLKEDGIDHWNSPNEGATNSYLFTALPGGFRNLSALKAPFVYLGVSGYYWSSTEGEEGKALHLVMHYNNISVELSDRLKYMGLSVRCIKD